MLAELLMSAEAREHAVTLTHLRCFLAWGRLRRSRPLAARLLSPAFRVLEGAVKRLQFHQALQMRDRFAREKAFQAAISENRRELNDLENRMDILEDQSEALQSRFRLLKNRVSGDGPQPDAPRAAGGLAGAGDSPADSSEKQRQAGFSDFYLEFEIAFRGSRKAIRKRLEHYLGCLPPAGPGAARVADIGCGRGEWLEMLREYGYTAFGVDSNPVMREACREKCLEVSGEPMHRWLQRQPDASLAAVTAFHIAEHLPFEDLLALVTEAKRLLAPGGVLVMETQNPESLRVSAYAFYHDPTHRNPLTPELLEFTARYAGFREVRLERLSEVPEELRIRETTETAAAFDSLLNAPRDLALIAFQPEGARIP